MSGRDSALDLLAEVRRLTAELGALRADFDRNRDSAGREIRRLADERDAERRMRAEDDAHVRDLRDHLKVTRRHLEEAVAEAARLTGENAMLRETVLNLNRRGK